MEIAEVCSLIEKGLSNCRTSVSGEGCNFSAVIVSEDFEGLRTVQRQQKVLSSVSAQLSTGELHALSMKVYTPSEWQQAIQKDPSSDVFVSENSAG